MDSKPSLGEKIRSLRRQLRMTQKELAGDDFTKSFISQVEKDQTRPSLKSLQIIASRLNKPVSYFLEDAPSQPLPREKEVHRLLGLGKRLCRENQYSVALNCLQQALEASAGNPGLRSTVLFGLGRCYDESGNLAKAAEILHEAFEQYVLLEDHEGAARALNALAAVCMKRRETDEAVNYLKRALAEAERTETSEEDLLVLRILTNLGIALSSCDRHEEAITYLERAERIELEQKDYFKFGDICHALSFIHGRAGRHRKSMEYANKARRFFEAVGDASQVARLNCNLGASLRALGQLREARETLNEAIKLGETTGDSTALSNAHEEMALLSQSENDLTSAIEHMMKALQYEVAPRRAVIMRITLADWQKENGSLKSAQKNLLEAEKLCLNCKLQLTLLADVYGGLGQVCGLMGQEHDAQAYLQKSVDLYRRRESQK